MIVYNYNYECCQYKNILIHENIIEFLIHCEIIIPSCMTQLGHQWWRFVYFVPNHYLKKCWHNICYANRMKPEYDLNQILTFPFGKNILKMVCAKHWDKFFLGVMC